MYSNTLPDTLVVFGKLDQKLLNDLKKKLLKNPKLQFVFLEEDQKKSHRQKIEVKSFFKENENIKNFHVLEKGNTSVLKNIAYDNLFSSFEIIKSNNDKRHSLFENISSAFNFFQNGLNLSSYPFADFGELFFKNIYNNLLNVNKFCLLQSLKGKFKNIPAIIVGSGPSLDKNINFLKNVKTKAFVFAANSCVKKLKNNNIDIDFFGGVDPSVIYEEVDNNCCFLYQNQTFYKNLQKCLNQTTNILLPDCGLFELEKFMNDQLKLTQNIDFEGGWNVSTVLIQTAHILGCSPIVLVGHDLCYKDKKYAKSLEVKNDGFSVKDTQDRDGNSVKIQDDWIMAKNWIEKFHRKKINMIINATEGGINLEGIKNITLTDVLKNFKIFPKDLKTQLNETISDKEFLVKNPMQTQEILKNVYDSLLSLSKELQNLLNDFSNQEFDFEFTKLKDNFLFNLLPVQFWRVLKPVFIKEVDNTPIDHYINKIIFFQNVITTHINLLKEVL
ncbi:MAG: motility associated factor glycosyltransferase family protein [Parachlamydiales bacterium]|nr:motility associated factor glycosyltransferase family protein [Parachlamydiales bacterium]